MQGEFYPQEYVKLGTKYAVAFPSSNDILDRMEVLGSSREIGNDSRFLFCRKTFKVSDQDNPRTPASLNKCLYFALVLEGESEKIPVITGVCLSFEIAKNRGKGEKDHTERMGGRHAFISMASAADEDEGVCKMPFLSFFNTKAPQHIFMMGENDFGGNREVKVNDVQRAKLAEAGKPIPILRSLGNTPNDMFMPVPHLRMYMCMREKHPAPQVKRWELLGHIGDLVCAYAVHLQDGSMDLVLARSRMIQFHVDTGMGHSEEASPEEQPHISSEGMRDGKDQRNRRKGKEQPSKEQTPSPPPDLDNLDHFPNLRRIKQNLMFEDIGDYNEDMLFLGGEFDLGGFSSELDEEGDSSDGADGDPSSLSHPLFSAPVNMCSSSSIWAARNAEAAKPWARSWLRPVMRSGD